MKKLILLIFLITTMPLRASQLGEMLASKTKNFETVKKFYLQLQLDVQQNEKTLFCAHVETYYRAAFNILEQDLELIELLKSSEKEIEQNYGKHIEDNSRSDLFALQGHKNSCKNINDVELEKFARGLALSLTNQNFLIMYHQQFLKMLQ